MVRIHAGEQWGYGEIESRFPVTEGLRVQSPLVPPINKIMKDILREIKYAYQRVVRGYDERIFWEFDSYFSQFISPLKKFCEKELSDVEHMNYNSKRKKIYSKMIELIKEFNESDYKDFYKYPNTESKLWEYFGKHIGYFWN